MVEPKFLAVDSTIWKFDTGWKSQWSFPSDKIQYTSDAYVQISKDGTQLSVYCYWGSSY